MKDILANNEETLYNDVRCIIDSGRKRVVESIYNETTKSYYALGRLIIENEQNGNIKAQYGKSTIQNLSKKLTLKYGKGFSVSTIKDCRQFYKKLQSMTGELDLQKSQSLTGEPKLSLYLHT